jgi:hypothetical protein
MSSAVEELVRLSWQVAREGKPGTRDALLTLAVAEGGIDDAVLAERCRKLLVAHRPDHWFATGVPLSQTLAIKPVVEVLTKLRAMFPRVRVQHLLMLGAAQRGPYSGQEVPLTRILQDLALVPQPSRGRSHARLQPPARTVSYATATAPSSSKSTQVGRSNRAEEDAALVALYWSILLAMAALLTVVIEPAAQDNKAA